MGLSKRERKRRRGKRTREKKSEATPKRDHVVKATIEKNREGRRGW